MAMPATKYRCAAMNRISIGTRDMTEAAMTTPNSIMPPVSPAAALRILIPKEIVIFLVSVR